MVIGASVGPRMGQLSMGIEYLCSAACPREERKNIKRNANNNFLNIGITSCRKEKRDIKINAPFCCGKPYANILLLPLGIESDTLLSV